MISSTAIAAVVAATFNLTCSGTHTTKAFQVDTTEPFSISYRIDLDKKLVCEGECKVTRPIKEVLPTSIILEEETIDTPSSYRMRLVGINRETGEYTAMSSDRSNAIGPASIYITKRAGQCVRSDFTGFPTPVTKF